MVLGKSVGGPNLLLDFCPMPISLYTGLSWYKMTLAITRTAHCTKGVLQGFRSTAGQAFKYGTHNFLITSLKGPAHQLLIRSLFA